MDTVLSVRNLFKSYGNILAVNDLSFTVYRGKIFGLLGPNGSGKSTTIRILLSLVHKDRGDIFLFNERLSHSNYFLRERMGALVESPDFYHYLSAYRNLEVLATLSSKNISKERIYQSLEWVGLSEFRDRKVGIFSHGMKQRLGIAQALLNDPELIILDEPANGLDPHGIIEIRKIILDLAHNKGKTIILSSHILREVELIADRMVVMHRGKTIAEGNVKELLTGKEKKIKINVNDPGKAARLLKEKGIQNVEMNDYNELIIHAVDHDPSQINSLLIQAGFSVNALTTVRSLEEYYLQLTDYAAESYWN